MWEGIVAKRLSHFESPSIESICIELTISKRKWCVLFAYCTSNHLPDLLDVFNLKNLFKEPTCFMFEKGSLIDIFFTTNVGLSIKHKVGISDFRKLTVTV